MLLYMFIIFTLFNYNIAYNPSCNTCKFFIPHKKDNNDYGLCGVYKKNYNLLGNEVTIHEYAVHCRKNEALCGENGVMYEPNDKQNMSIPDEIYDKYEELANQCCGEVNEKNEIEQLEREMFEVMLKIKKYNSKNIYRTTKDLFKLFKRDKKA